MLIGDTIRLTVFSALMWAASDLAELFTRTHYDLRATRILVARQTYMLRQMGIASGALEPEEGGEHRRSGDAS